MNGGVIANTPIAVDFWKIRECPQARIFFLTHLHGDHVTGLTSSWNYPIYCSEITGLLLKQRYGLQEKLIRTLQIDCAQIIYLDNEHQEQMTVTALEANHCPGSVMFLFQGYFGTILHTGDFRFRKEMMSSPLGVFSGQIDLLYMDNTYCCPGATFPTREATIENIICIIQRHPLHDIIIGIRSLGKENLLCKLAIYLQEMISVPTRYYENLQIFDAPNVFENNSSDCRIRAVPFHSVNNRLLNYLNKTSQTIAILPTAIYCGLPEDARPYINQDDIFVVPYSDHSSYNELVDFVSFIKPRQIIPIVNGLARGPFGTSLAERADMSCFDKFMRDKNKNHIDIPATVKAFMNDPISRPPAQDKNGVRKKCKKMLRKTMGNRKSIRRGVIYDSPSELSETNNTIIDDSSENNKVDSSSPLIPTKTNNTLDNGTENKENTNSSPLKHPVRNNSLNDSIKDVDMQLISNLKAAESHCVNNPLLEASATENGNKLALEPTINFEETNIKSTSENSEELESRTETVHDQWNTEGKVAMKRTFEYLSPQQKSAAFDKICGVKTYSRSPGPKRLKNAGIYVNYLGSAEKTKSASNIKSFSHVVDTFSETEESDEKSEISDNEVISVADGISKDLEALDCHCTSKDSYFDENFTMLKDQCMEKSPKHSDIRYHSTPKCLKERVTKSECDKQVSSQRSQRKGQHGNVAVELSKKYEQSKLSEFAVRNQTTTKSKPNKSVRYKKRTKSLAECYDDYESLSDYSLIVVDEYGPDEFKPESDDFAERFKPRSYDIENEFNPMEKEKQIVGIAQQEWSLIDSTGYSREAQLNAFMHVFETGVQSYLS